MSDIQFLGGTIGSGKSFTAARYRCLELRRSERMIVTNLSGWYGDEPDIPEGKLSLAEWCHEFVERPIDIEKRVLILDSSQMFEFFRFLPSGNHKLPNVMPMREESWKVGGKTFTDELPDLAWRQQLQIDGKLPNGCLFILDEAHLHFDARKWQRCSTAVMHYMSQLRKLNDDIILISQNPEKIDKNFRRDATEVVYVKNCGKARYFMGVKFPGKIKLFKWPFFPARNDKPQSTSVIELKEERYQDTYDTMAGVGLSGQMDPEALPRGGHWWRWVAVGAVALAVIILGPRIGMNLIGRTIGGFMGQFHAGVGNKLGHTGETAVTSPLQVVGSVVLPEKREIPSASRSRDVVFGGPMKDADVWVTGISWDSGSKSAHVYLSDGTGYASGDGHLQWVGDREVRIDGVYYSRHAPRPGAGPGRGQGATQGVGVRHHGAI